MMFVYCIQFLFNFLFELLLPFFQYIRRLRRMNFIEQILLRYTQPDDVLVDYVSMFLEDPVPAWDDLQSHLEGWCGPESSVQLCHELRKFHAMKRANSAPLRLLLPEAVARSPTAKPPSKSITISDKHIDPTPSSYKIDASIRTKILQNYMLRPMPTPGPSTQLSKTLYLQGIDYFNQQKQSEKQKKRFYDSQVVTSSGEKYIDLLAKSKNKTDKV